MPVPTPEHEVAFVLDHVNVLDCPVLMVEGLAVSVTVGGGLAVTVTVVEADAEPPAPVQVSVYVVVVVGDSLAEPDVPVPTPEHEVAFVLLHVTVDDWPEVIEDGLAEIETVGGGFAVTVTVAEPEAEPLELVHVSV